MPGKGWTNVSLKKEVFEEYEKMANDRNESVGEMFSALLSSIKTSIIDNVINEESRKTALIQTYFAFDSFIQFNNNYSFLEVPLRGVDLRNFRLVSFNDLNDKTREILREKLIDEIRLRELVKIAKIEGEKIENILDKTSKIEVGTIEKLLGQVPRGWRQSERLIIPPSRLAISINSNIGVASLEQFNWHLTESFGINASYIDDIIEQLEDVNNNKKLNLDHTIEILSQIYEEMSKIMKKMDAVIKASETKENNSR